MRYRNILLHDISEGICIYIGEGEEKGDGKQLSLKLPLSMSDIYTTKEGGRGRGRGLSCHIISYTTNNLSLKIMAISFHERSIQMNSTKLHVVGYIRMERGRIPLRKESGGTKNRSSRETSNERDFSILFFSPSRASLLIINFSLPARGVP